MPYAVISGATQGIGRAIAGKFLENGYAIAICARTQADLDAVQKEWKEKYPAAQILTYSTDVSKKEYVIAFANEVLKTFPQIDVLVNNAGTYYPGSLATEPDGNLESLMAINMYSAYHLTRQLLPAMKQAGRGHIFNMCSVASLKAYENGGAYSVSKYAMLGFSENLREELKPFNIKVTAVCPGATYSRSWEGSSHLQHKMLQAADVAEMVWSAANLSPAACVETIVIRPISGDL